MVRIESEIEIAASVETTFDLARSVEAHLEAERRTKERVVAGRRSGLLELNDTITFEGVHFGIRQRLAARIVEMERPTSFVDEMQRGAFKTLRHTHRFSEHGGRTVMRDILEFSAPLGPLGWIAKRLFLKHYMQDFIERHQQELRRIAERS
jgi:ligand-binding SRPBCC domain-containing protein